MLGNFACFFFFSSVDFFKINFFKIIFQEYHQSVKQFRSRSGPTFRRAWSGSKLFAKVISRWKKSPLVGKELTLKAPSKICSRRHSIFFFFFFFKYFRQNKSWHFMWIVCQADNSHEMSRLVFSEKKKIIIKKIKKLSSAAVVIGALGLMGVDTLDRVSIILSKADNICYFLLAFLQIKPLLKKGTLKIKNLLLRGVNSFVLFGEELFSEGRQNNFDRAVLLLYQFYFIIHQIFAFTFKQTIFCIG